MPLKKKYDSEEIYLPIYLVQRGEFKANKDFKGIDSLINLDYMGSAEFEYGALPTSLKEMCKTIPTVFAQPDIRHPKNNYQLQIVTSQPEEVPYIAQFFKDQINGKRHSLKEATYLDWLHKDTIKTNFWWDVDNHWMATFGKSNGENLVKAIEMVKVKKGW